MLNRCFPRPPRDVYERMVAMYKPGDPIYTVEHEGATVGMVYCARHSKGGHLESLAIAPDYRGLGLADHLVQILLHEHPGAVTLTTRIPEFFARLGFRNVEKLEDGSTLMVHTARQPSEHAATVANTHITVKQ